MIKKKKVTRRPPLNAKHYEAIALLSTCSGKRITNERIAKKLRISRRTLYRWRQRADFAREIRNAIDREINALSRSVEDKLRGRMRGGDIDSIARFLALH